MKMHEPTLAELKNNTIAGMLLDISFGTTLVMEVLR
jgi:hypothetical protein